MIKGNRSIILLAILVSFILSSSVALASVGVSPIEIDYKDLMRGGYAETYITVSNPSTDEQVVTIGVEGQSAAWSRVEPNNFNVEGHGVKIVRLIVEPPLDTPNGIYKSTIYINAVDVYTAQAVAQGMGVAVTSGVGILQSVNVTGVQIRQYNVEGVNIPDTEECRDIQVIVNARNSGNVRLNADIGIDIYTESGEYMRSFNYTSAEMMPTKVYNFIIRMQPGFGKFTCMPVGVYKAKVTASLDGSTIFTTEVPFDVLERGTLTISGVLQNMTLPSNVTMGDTVKIEGTFKNTGQLPVLAKLKSEIYKDGKLSTAIEGDQLEVNIGETKTLTAYWRTGWIGDYNVKSTVFYESRNTDTKEADVKVVMSQTMIYSIAGVVIAIAIIVLYVVLRKPKSRKGEIQ